MAEMGPVVPGRIRMGKSFRSPIASIVLLVASLATALPAGAVKVTSFQGALRGFPALRDLSGKTLANGDFAQWLEGGKLHVKLTYHFLGTDRTVEETAEFKQDSQLIQEQWSNQELINGRISRRFSVDFVTGQAIAEKRENGQLKRWAKKVSVKPGQTFAGLGFMLAIMNLRGHLMGGEKVELETVGFAPEPRLVAVQIYHGSSDQIQMAGRTLEGDRFIVHAKIPWIAELLINVPDSDIWLARGTPPGFLRKEGPLMEPGDPIIRVDLFPGDDSGPAKPASEKAARLK